MKGYCAEDPSSCLTFPPSKTKAFINTLITDESLCVTLKMSTLVTADSVSSLGSAQYLECREPQPCEMASQWTLISRLSNLAQLHHCN